MSRHNIGVCQILPQFTIVRLLRVDFIVTGQQGTSFPRFGDRLLFLWREFRAIGEDTSMISQWIVALLDRVLVLGQGPQLGTIV